MANPFTAPGRLTSGRRTYRGNMLVGGVPNSHHLDGSAGDYVGTTPDALRNYFGSGVKIIPEGDHLHVQGLPPETFPYYGNQGIAGLVNGVDTSAPKGTPAPPQGGWGLRPDGTQKGNGFLGVLKRPDGGVSTEISVGLPIDGREMDVPTLVPGLTRQERNWLLSTPVSRVAKELPDSIRQKAVTNAMARIGNGLSPFYGNQPQTSLASLVAPIPVNTGADPSSMQPASLGSLADLPQGNIPKPNHTRQTLGNIAGILGDALMAYGGMQPQFGPNLMRQQDEDRQMGFEREKLNAQLEMARQKALEPPQYIQNAQAWAALSPEQKRLVLQQQDAVNPINVSTPQGTQNVPRSTVKTINGKNYYSIGGEWYEESE